MIHMKHHILGLTALLALAFTSCDTSGVKKDTETTKTNKAEKDDRTEAEKLLDPKSHVVDKKSFMNGMKIQWFEKGNGEPLRAGEVYEINFKLTLENGQAVDGNHLLKRSMIPFLVGYNMQTSGWDLAMNELHVGDFVEIYLPPKLARGEKGIPGVIPPNAPNIIFLRVGKRIAPTANIDGTKVWRLEESLEFKDIKVGDNSEVAIHYFVGTKTNPRYDNSYQRGVPFTFRLSDNGLVPGLRKAMKGRALFDKLWILVPAKEAYGDKGLIDLVKPNEDLFYDIIVRDVDGKAPKMERQ
jgi:FKBP-type peptidyl-prolyl cis-trans isomerase